MPGLGATRKSMPPLMALCAIGFGAMNLGACAQITVVTDREPPRSEWKFGVLAIDLAASNQNTIIQSAGVGIVSTPSGATLGYANARIVRIGDECRVVIATKDLEAASKDTELLRLLMTTHKACAA